ncbi:MAG: hypothetical protein HPY83_19570 [Anaerolineae bacterium]|nr:hypothetical protein [Anaerolineae bacterium]
MRMPDLDPDLRCHRKGGTGLRPAPPVRSAGGRADASGVGQLAAEYIRQGKGDEMPERARLALERIAREGARKLQESGYTYERAVEEVTAYTGTPGAPGPSVTATSWPLC